MNRFKTLIIIGAVLALFLALFFFIQFTGFLFTIQEKYADAPSWLIIIYIGGTALISLLGLVFIYRISQFGSTPKKDKEKPREIIDDASFTKKITKAKQSGADTEAIESDWENLISLRQSQEVTVALFGEINAGKSSLISTILNKNITISAKGGATQSIEEYQFSQNSRDYRLIDMPGSNETDSVSEDLIREKAIKSHIVVFVMDEDLTQSAFESYQHLTEYNKPTIIAINKADYYSVEEQIAISKQIQAKLPQTTPIVWVKSATTKIVEKHFDSGEITTSEVKVNGDINALLYAIEELTFDRLALDSRLNDSYFLALENEVENSLTLARQDKAQRVIKSYSQKAIFGGMAAVGPGTDVLLQGYLGMGMTKALCAIYEVNIKEVDLESMLDILGGKMKKELTIILALVGNVCKAFPGVGTVAGGALHAVAYGLIFESVGTAMMICLEKHNSIDQTKLLQELEGQIGENLEKRAKRLAQTVLFRE